MDTGFIDALLKNFKRCEGRKEDDKNSIDRCCSCSISGIWICPLVLYQSGGGIRKRIYDTGAGLPRILRKRNECDIFLLG